MKPKAKPETKLYDLKTNFENSAVPGTYIAYATVSNMPLEIGMLWFRHVMKRHIEILDVYTSTYFRRRGIASTLLADLRKAYPTRGMMTESANPVSARWLLKNGFHKNGDEGWFLPALKPLVGRKKP